MLDYGYRSKCCKAPIRLGKQKKNYIIKQVWVCTKCRKSNIDIISNEDLYSQYADIKEFEPFSEKD